MNRELVVAVLVSVAVHASLVILCNPLPPPDQGEKGTALEIQLLGMVQFASQAANEVLPKALTEPVAQPLPHPDPDIPMPDIQSVIPIPDDMPISVVSKLDNAFSQLDLAVREPQPEPAEVTDISTTAFERPKVDRVTTPTIPMVNTVPDTGQPELTTGQIEDFRSRYLRSVLRKMEEAKRYPSLAYRRNIQGMTTIAFTIAADGSVGSTTIEKSSGHAVLDRAAQDMVTAAVPFPPLPDELGVRELRVVAPVHFKIDHAHTW